VRWLILTLILALASGCGAAGKAASASGRRDTSPQSGAAVVVAGVVIPQSAAQAGLAAIGTAGAAFRSGSNAYGAAHEQVLSSLVRDASVVLEASTPPPAQPDGRAEGGARASAGTSARL
jgi:hypothetical protein